MAFKVISFYRYIYLDTPEVLRKEVFTKCCELKVLGRILIAEEGINGAVCGEENRIKEFRSFLEKYFTSLSYREQIVEDQVYHKLVVRVRKEVVHFGESVDLKQAGTHLSPREIHEWYSTKKDFVIIDARNAHEAEVGTFQNALVLPIHTFREFPQAVKNLDHLKQKEIVLYCTGGVRCEKASAYMKQVGFSSVSQLEGGIIHYMNKYPEGYFKGACFVFDDRLSSYTEKPVSFCVHCGKVCAEYTNCYHLDCDALFVCCKACRERMKNTCSAECLAGLRQRKVKEKKENLHVVGIVENYYSHQGVALVSVKSVLKKNTFVSIQGRTTKDIVQKIRELYDYDGNILKKAQRGMRVTFPVHEKVRKNDIIFLVEE